MTQQRKPKSVAGVASTASTAGTVSAYPFLTCPDLETLERPRYFTGQLLTAEELTGEQTYVAAKQRLHHRYLHGPRGRIVTGLQVAKNDNPGFLSIGPGYAIDYCGNDIVVPTTATFNVAEQIRANASDLGPLPDAVWNPGKATPGEGPPNSQQHYWLTIAYDEQEARPASALRQNTASYAVGRKKCGCGGRGCSGYGNVQVASKQVSSPTLCEPTRIREVYRFDVVAARDATTALSDARLTGDNRLVLARITVQYGEMMEIENGVAARQAEPPSLPPPSQATPQAVIDLQNTVTALQDALRALQDEIALLKGAAAPPKIETSAAPSKPETAIVSSAAPSEPASSSEVVEPPPGEQKSDQSVALESRPPDETAPQA